MVLRALLEAPFEPLHRASLLCLAFQMAFLVAIASGHRISSLHALSIEPGHILWEPRVFVLCLDQTSLLRISLRLLSRLSFSYLLSRSPLPLKQTKCGVQSEP